jgi:hypothetical protein
MLTRLVAELKGDVYLNTNPLLTGRNYIFSIFLLTGDPRMFKCLHEGLVKFNAEDKEVFILSAAAFTLALVSDRPIHFDNGF